MQVFAVALALFVLGGADGLICIAVYLLIGTAGLPVFSGFNAGLSALAGPTGGYLYGFLFFALLYLVLEKTAGCGDSGGRKILFAFAGMLLCYAAGVLHYCLVFFRGEKGIVSVLWTCVLPYVIPDAVKILLAFRISVLLRKTGIGC